MKKKYIKPETIVYIVDKVNLLIVSPDQSNDPASEHYPVL